MARRTRIKIKSHGYCEEQLREFYDAIVNKIEKGWYFDGRGTVSRYTCKKCKIHVYTTYRDKGVIPCEMKCPWCGDIMRHDSNFNQDEVPGLFAREWYRPSFEEVLLMSQEEVEHVLRGGLMLEGVDDAWKQ